MQRTISFRRRLAPLACGMALVALSVVGGGAVGAAMPGMPTSLGQFAQPPGRDDIAADPVLVVVPDSTPADDTPAPDSVPPDSMPAPDSAP